MPVAKGEPLDPAATRARILDTASRVFYEKGTLAVGVNELAAEAGVSKVTLYRHFDSKEALVAAFLRRRSDRVSAWLREVVATGSSRATACSPSSTPSASGSESPRSTAARSSTARSRRAARSREARAIAAAHLDRHLDLLGEHGEALARQLLLLVEGATTVAFVRNDPSAAQDARTAAEALLEQAARRP